MTLPRSLRSPRRSEPAIEDTIETKDVREVFAFLVFLFTGRYR